MYPENIGKYIAKKRKERKITQKEFAEKLGVTDKTVSRWENGHYMPDITLLQDIATILDVTISELLNGEDGKKENVDDSINKIVEVSKQNINISKRKLIMKGALIISIVIVLLGILSAYCIRKIKNRIINNEFQYEYKPGAKSSYGSSVGIIEKEDGWICEFNLQYDVDFNQIESYGYGCDNYKYEKIENFPMSNGAEKEYLVKFNHPSTLFNEDYQNDSRIVYEYFEKYKFNKEITIDDLKDMKVKYYKKEDIVEAFNKALTGEKINTLGNYENFYDNNHILKSEEIDDMQYFVGYYLNQGHIAYVSIELKIKDEYLSDKVKNNKASSDEIELYNKIEQVEKDMIKTQMFIQNRANIEDKRLRLLDLVCLKLNNPEEMKYENQIWMEIMNQYY